MEIKFNADKIKVYGQKADGGYNVTVETGEYSKFEMASLVMLPANVNFEVIIRVVERDSQSKPPESDDPKPSNVDRLKKR